MGSGHALPDGMKGPRASVLGKRAAIDIRPHAAPKEQQCDTQSEHLLHFQTPCWTHKSSTTEGFPARGGFPMDAKFAVGDKVDQSPRNKFVGTIKALFTTKESETRCAVEVEGHGTPRLCSEHTIAPHH